MVVYLNSYKPRVYRYLVFIYLFNLIKKANKLYFLHNNNELKLKRISYRSGYVDKTQSFLSIYSFRNEFKCFLNSFYLKLWAIFNYN